MVTTTYNLIIFINIDNISIDVIENGPNFLTSSLSSYRFLSSHDVSETNIHA